MDRGFVALLDVLGFSSLVASNAQGAQLQSYLRCLEDAVKADDGTKRVDYVVFSDSIILTVADESRVGLQALVESCSRLFALLLDQEIPIRGAIAFGSFLRAAIQDGVFVAGKAIIDAYNFEKAQDWVGIMLAPSTLKQVGNLQTWCNFEPKRTGESEAEFAERLRWCTVIQQCSRIPFHARAVLDSNDYQGIAVLPNAGRGPAGTFANGLLRSIQKLEWLKSLAPDPPAQEKYNASSNWLRQVCNFLDSSQLVRSGTL